MKHLSSSASRNACNSQCDEWSAIKNFLLEINTQKSLQLTHNFLIDSMWKIISYEKQIQNSSRAHSIIFSHSIKMFSSHSIHSHLIGVEILAVEMMENFKVCKSTAKVQKF